MSSGFLAFGAQAGFLAGVEDSRIPVDGLCGTSSGALAAALWAAGHGAEDVFALLTEQPPLRSMHWHRRPWRGLFDMTPVVARLCTLLPRTFRELGRPFAAGVVTREGTPALIRSGSLPEAVAASCAIPYLFAPVVVDGTPYSDGGAADRLGLGAWREARGARRTVVHVIDASLGAVGQALPDDIVVVRSVRSGARLWNLGPARQRFEQARAATSRVLHSV